MTTGDEQEAARSEPRQRAPVAARRRSVLAAYVQLTKPRVIELLLVTTVPSMVLAAGRLPGLSVTVGVLVGGALSAGGANAINCYVDRDRDRAMRRTRHRPIPAGDVPPTAALMFGVVLEVVATAVLWWSANLFAAVLALGAAVFYVVVYSIWLKPRTPQNIVIGGAAGAAPVLVGWAAVRGTLGWPALVLFAVIFAWTPAHFWALALRYRDDYEGAAVPMLPVIARPERTVRSIFRYALATVALSVALPLSADVGAVYLMSAVVLGGLFLVRSWGLRAQPSPGRAVAFFTFSNTYLALLFAAVAVDVLVR